MKEHQKSLIGNKVNELNDSPIPVDIPRMTSERYGEETGYE